MKIITERLYLRPVCDSDKTPMFGYRADKEINKYLTLIPKSVEDMAEFIAQSSAEIDVPDTWYQLAIIKQSDNQLIGDIGLHFLAKDEVEIGYTLDKRHHGKGFATEALIAVMNHLVEKLDKKRFIAKVDPENKSSIMLLKRLGFHKEAHHKKSLLLHGKWVDDVIYHKEVDQE